MEPPTGTAEATAHCLEMLQYREVKPVEFFYFNVDVLPSLDKKERRDQSNGQD